MLKKEIQHENWDGEKTVTTAHFHITKSDLVDNITVLEDLEALESMLEGKERELKPNEIKQIVDLVKFFMKLAYGVREGDRFVKNDELWTEFSQTAAYDELFWGMFQEPESAVEFLFALLPNDLRAQAETAVKERQAQKTAKAPAKTKK